MLLIPPSVHVLVTIEDSPRDGLCTSLRDVEAASHIGVDWASENCVHLHPRPDQRARRDCVIENAAAFEIAYAGLNGMLANAAKDRMLTMAP